MDDVHAMFTGPFLDEFLLDGDGVLLPVPCRVPVVGHPAGPWHRRNRGWLFFFPPRTLISFRSTGHIDLTHIALDMAPSGAGTCLAGSIPWSVQPEPHESRFMRSCGLR